MASTFTSLHYHIVFSTKNRSAFINPKWASDFHNYLGGTVRGLGGTPHGIGGVADHVHLLIGLRPTHCLSDFIRELKKSSSAFAVCEFREAAFRWQEGYAAFTVSPTSLEAVQGYIARQEEHHHHATFREELIKLLVAAGIEYEDKYLD